MARPRFRKLKKDKQRLILNNALEEFSEHGFERASFNRIIQDSGISKGAMYYYFDDKWDLFSTAILEHFGNDWREAEPIPAAKTVEEYWKSVEAFMVEMAQRHDNTPEMRGIAKLWPELRNDSRARELMEKAWKPIMEVMEQMIRDGQKLGAVRTDLPVPLLSNLAWGLGEMFDTYTYEQMNNGVEFDFGSIGALYVDLLRRLVEQRPRTRQFGDVFPNEDN